MTVYADLQGNSVPDPDSLVQLTRRSPGSHTTSLTYTELAFYAANATSFRNIIGVSERNQAVFGEAQAAATGTARSEVNAEPIAEPPTLSESNTPSLVALKARRTLVMSCTGSRSLP